MTKWPLQLFRGFVQLQNDHCNCFSAFVQLQNDHRNYLGPLSNYKMTIAIVFTSLLNDKMTSTNIKTLQPNTYHTILNNLTPLHVAND